MSQVDFYEMWEWGYKKQKAIHPGSVLGQDAYAPNLGLLSILHSLAAK